MLNENSDQNHCANAQADLSLCWAHTSQETSHVVAHLITVLCIFD